ncbi:venom metalloproteinase BumaMPs1-like [Haemaphysalis longicornis]
MLVRLTLVLSISFLYVAATYVPKGAELVFPQIYEDRDDVGSRILRLNDKLTLNLKRSSVVHEDFYLRTYRQGVPQHTYFDIYALEDELYHDEKHFASVFVSEDGRSVKVEGVVGPNLKIRPLENMERTDEGHVPHALELISNDDPNYKTVYGVPITERNGTVVEERLTQAERYQAVKVHCEVRLVVDSKFRQGFTKVRDMVRYLLIEFNVVKLRYLTATRPEIHLKLRAIEVTTVSEERKYMKWIQPYVSIDALKTLYELVNYVQKRNNSYGRYDLVYFATATDMVAVEGSRYEKSLQGYAFVGSVCTHNRVGLGEDQPMSYIGIRIMAHEMGHTLGCSHDGSAIDGTIRGFKADSNRCPWEQGFLMSYIEEDHRSMKFSSCCDYSMSLVAWSTEINCLYYLSTGSRLKKYRTRRLPGRYLGKNTQCKMTYPTLVKTYFMKNLWRRGCLGQCFVPGWQFQASDSHWPVLLIDGTTCAPNMMCVNGDCVPKRRRYPYRIYGK